MVVKKPKSMSHFLLTGVLTSALMLTGCGSEKTEVREGGDTKTSQKEVLTTETSNPLTIRVTDEVKSELPEEVQRVLPEIESSLTGFYTDLSNANYQGVRDFYAHVYQDEYLNMTLLKYVVNDVEIKYTDDVYVDLTYFEEFNKFTVTVFGEEYFKEVSKDDLESRLKDGGLNLAYATVEIMETDSFTNTNSREFSEDFEYEVENGELKFVTTYKYALEKEE